jgi:diguanylate cyclase (GGDEF)-like protein/PAS domain S-box-containing protein
MLLNELTVTNYKFSDLVDVVEFSKILDSFYSATGIPNGLIAIDGEVISQSGWISACENFHKVSTESKKNCLKSNFKLIENIRDGEITTSLCKNGLIDYATPIIIKEQRIATLFLGQVLTKSPNLKSFEKQSNKFNFDKKTYLKAIKEVPIVSNDKIQSSIKCIVSIAQMLAQNGLSKLEHFELEKNLLNSNKKVIHLSDILDFSPNGIGWSNVKGEIEYLNHQFTKLFGYEKDDIPTLDIWLKKAFPNSKYRQKIVNPWYKSLENSYKNAISSSELEVTVKCKDGTYRHVLIRVSLIGDKKLFNFSDITIHWKSEQRNRAHDRILGLVAKGVELKDVLEEILRTIEFEDSDSLCSILLLDKEGNHLINSIKNRLPNFYNNAINGLKIAVGAGSCGTAAMIKERVIVDDIMTHKFWQPYKEIAKQANLRSCWSEPIIASNGKVLGTFAIYHKNPSKPNESDIERINFAANIAAIAIENKDNRIDLEKQAYTDYLTGLNNRRSFIEKTEMELHRKERYGREFSLIMFDIDYFKYINDKYGHNTGDLVLKEIANVCYIILREVDIAGRIGGEEFAILLPETNIIEAEKVAERLRIAISDTKVFSSLDEEVKFAASFGVTFTNNNTNILINELLNQADTALYKAKNSGRNKVVIYEN